MLDWSVRDRAVLEAHQSLLRQRSAAFAEHLYDYLFSNPSIADRLYRVRDEGGDMGGFVRRLLGLLLSLVSPSLERDALSTELDFLCRHDFRLPWLLGVYRLFFDFLLDAVEREPALDADTRRALRSALGKQLCFELGLVVEHLQGQSAERHLASSQEASTGLDAADETLRALRQGELVLYYQPQVATADGTPLGVEALLRWQHPQRGLLLPGQFLSAFEASGNMVALTRWVLHEALRQAVVWKQRFNRDIPVAVNVPVALLAHVSPPRWLLEAIDVSGREAGLLQIEVSGARLEQLSGADGVFMGLAERGVRIAIDNFGKGGLALPVLGRLPIDRVKLDRSLLDLAARNEEETPLLRALVDLGHGLGWRVLAEGVETEREQGLAAASGCDAIQGFHVLRPRPAAELTEWIGRRLAS